jgi:CheY-like chemotaxis protein
LCILVVEDELVIRLSAVEALAEAGYEVMEAEHAPRAVELIEQCPRHFTMLVTDHNMPPHRMTGAALVHHMRGTYPTIPMLIATGTPGEIDAEFAEEHRVHLLPKPYSGHTLTGVDSRLLTAG